MTILNPGNAARRIDFRYDLFPNLTDRAARYDALIQYRDGSFENLFEIRGSNLLSADGVVTSFRHTYEYVFTGSGGSNTYEDFYSFTDFTAPADRFLAAYAQKDPLALTILVLSGADSLNGSNGSDYIWGLAGDDSIQGGFGDDTLGGDEGRDWVRGGQGADFIHGGAAFDDLHGNEGNDTVSGGDDDDWVVGGKDQDSLSGDAGADIVYGNLGDDTCDGGQGDDIVRGGQGNDVVSGGLGADFVAGDLGADTLSGGAGADIFHTHAAAGLDRVLDFSAAEGDRVNLLPGTAYTLSQQGADTVIDMGGGNQMILVNVSLASLPDGWIFGAV
ncbi:MAG: calcium-binding protein [Alphaproteobacteria bacterium]|nr:calcium-binding protein [Alphaproteobacteria bacterium]MBU1513517.1 calcium-binding protein [Alphaproteobacteria bacterium]MBU2094838.1 calcium-binding protein [Alphaproteobacteria bacterium]MBU2151095.1 calcium-binding protein [Alphaproteobacteria bacterium]MBU2309378.1 calcium-binding protein [Alphaproteobacteria bacterium]